MDQDKAEEMLMQDGWTTMYVGTTAEYLYSDTADEGFYTKMLVLLIRCGPLHRIRTMGRMQVRS